MHMRVCLRPLYYYKRLPESQKITELIQQKQTKIKTQKKIQWVCKVPTSGKPPIDRNCEHIQNIKVNSCKKGHRQ